MKRLAFARVLSVAAFMLFMAGCSDEDAVRPGLDAGDAQRDTGVPYSNNSPPVAAREQLTLQLAQDTTLEFDPAVTDADGDALTYQVSTPSHGTITGSAPPFLYASTVGYAGSDELQVTVSDGKSSVVVTVVLNILASNGTPVASDSLFWIDQDTAKMFKLNAVDRDDDALTFTVLTQPEHGSLTGTPPNLVYTPDRYYSGGDKLTFRAADGAGESNVAGVGFIIKHVITCGDSQTEGSEACDDGNSVDTDDCRNSCVLTTCGDGVVGAGEACDDGNSVDTDGCRTNCTVSSCGDGVVQADVEQCDDGNRVDTDACRNSCVPAACGDSVVQAGVEPCDDGDADDGDECRNNCSLPTCGDGIVDTGEQCDDANQVDTDACRNNCLNAECGDGAVEADVEQCDDGNTNNLDGCRNDCKVATCGDGVVRADIEQCDDGNTDNSDGCLNTCKLSTCGDGIIQVGTEQCDDGNDVNTDGCLSTCKTSTCGDGFVQAGVEQCDDGNTANTDGCLNTCNNASCGDGFVQASVEQCDDANGDNTDACLNTCRTATCGDGFVVAGVEQCDDGNGNNADACLSTCVAALCGDGFVQLGVEQCDDANGNNTDACLNNCAVATCGDGFVRGGVEQCDDANVSNDDGCLNTCLAASCGDGFVRAGVEQCDDANGSNGDGCLNSCVAATCGDGFVRVGVEQCDDANGSNTDACLNACVTATCGDGFVESGVEQCDDGNGSSTDACLSSCVLAVCGDGIVEAGVEECDDANQNNTDGCRNDCTAPVCGDGVLDGGEECDDGNSMDNDGCGHSCRIERCGDDLVQFSRGEQCDDGNVASGDGCDATCLAEPFVTTIPVLVSSTLNCTTSVANAARKVAVDGSGNIYAVMTCDGVAYAIISTDRGNTFSAPFNLSEIIDPQDPPSVAQIAIGAAKAKVAHVAVMLNDGRVMAITTKDTGTTWSSASLVGQAANPSSGLGLQAFNDDVFIGYSVPDGVAVARSKDGTTNTFTTVSVDMGIAFFDVSYDVRQQIVAVTTDTPTFHVRVSTDLGATFAPEVNPPGQEFYSDWSNGNGQIFAVGINLGSLGDSSRLYIIPTSSPATSTFVSGLPVVTTAQSRVVFADDAGNAFVGSQLDGGGIRVDRLAFGASAFGAARLLNPSGSSPALAGLPGNQGVAVAYTVGGQVFVTVQVY